MLAVNSKKIIIDNHRVYHIDIAGDPANPPILLLHGFTGSHSSWAPLLPALLPYHRLIIPDLPGHGDSFLSSDLDEMTMTVTAHDLKAILQLLGIQRTGILGYSMGGRLALHTALCNRELVECLILESSTAGIPNFKEQMARRQQDESLADEIESRGLAWFVEYWSHLPLFATQSRLPFTIKEREQNIRLGHNPYGLAQSLRAAGTGRQESLWPELPYFQIPTLIITGRDDEKFVKIGHQLHQQLALSQFLIIDNAGHTVHLEQPERFLSVVIEFLQTIKMR